ncbi:hypothetical protein MMC17_006811 [Xylographa soralifera]|nr:hypothetical protein [Xylographa soralifera]
MSLRPNILILDQDGGLFTEVWSGLVTALKATAAVTFDYQPTSAALKLHSRSFTTVLVVKPDIYFAAAMPNRHLRDQVRDFAELQGGTVLFCGTFSSMTRPTTFNLYFGSEWQLPWKFGDYHRTTMTLNPAFRVSTAENASFNFDLDAADLESAYSQKAVHVKGALRMSMLYVPTEDSELESLVWQPSPINDLTQSPTVFAACGKGHVGFLGDVNGEIGTTKTILALSGLSKGTKPPSVSSGEASPDAGGWYCAACGKQELRTAAVQDEGFKRCGECQVCHYCSRICQRAHW